MESGPGSSFWTCVFDITESFESQSIACLNQTLKNLRKEAKEIIYIISNMTQTNAMKIILICWLLKYNIDPQPFNRKLKFTILLVTLL